jgi:hypothetical protein
MIRCPATLRKTLFILFILSKKNPELSGIIMEINDLREFRRPPALPFSFQPFAFSLLLSSFPPQTLKEQGARAPHMFYTTTCLWDFNQKIAGRSEPVLPPLKGKSSAKGTRLSS